FKTMNTGKNVKWRFIPSFACSAKYLFLPFAPKYTNIGKIKVRNNEKKCIKLANILFNKLSFFTILTSNSVILLLLLLIEQLNLIVKDDVTGDSRPMCN